MYGVPINRYLPPGFNNSSSIGQLITDNQSMHQRSDERFNTIPSRQFNRRFSSTPTTTAWMTNEAPIGEEFSQQQMPWHNNSREVQSKRTEEPAKMM